MIHFIPDQWDDAMKGVKETDAPPKMDTSGALWVGILFASVLPGAGRGRIVAMPKGTKL